jgi:hypothetical protein
VTPQLVPDGAGDAIIAWQDYRNGDNNAADIYAQRVNSAGVGQWAANGAAISTATGDQSYPQLIPDRSGGAIIAWQDSRSGANFDIDAQGITANGLQ